MDIYHFGAGAAAAEFSAGALPGIFKSLGLMDRFHFPPFLPIILCNNFEFSLKKVILRFITFSAAPRMPLLKHSSRLILHSEMNLVLIRSARELFKKTAILVAQQLLLL